MMKNKFICPIPWISLSLGAKNVPRLCCHQDVSTELPIVNMAETARLRPHTERAKEEMLAGLVPRECQSCHQLEQAGCFSPRLEYLDKFDFDINGTNPVKYLDITPDNECNLECIMCSPVYSQKLSSFYEKTYQRPPEGAWETDLGHAEIKEMLPHLMQVTLAGGEPFLSRKALAFIRLLSESEKASQLTLRIFSNFSHLPRGIFDQLASFKKVELILSIDSVEENYEFIRFPAKWQNLLLNIQALKKNLAPHFEINVHTVLNAVNWPHIGRLIDFFRDSFPESPSVLPIFVEIDSRSLLHPRVLPSPLWEEGKAGIEEALKRLSPQGEGHDPQIADLRRLILKMEKEEMSERFMDYKIYLKKIEAHRLKRQ